MQNSQKQSIQNTNRIRTKHQPIPVTKTENPKRLILRFLRKPYVPERSKIPKPTPDFVNDKSIDDLTAVLNDEFEIIPYGDLIVRSDALAQRLTKETDKFGLVKISGGMDRYPSYPYFIESVYRGDLSRAVVPQERLKVQQCNAIKGKFRVRIYLSDRKLPIKPCDDQPLIPKETILFNSINFHYDNITLSAYEDVGFDPYTNPNGEYSKRVFEVLKEMIENSDGSLFLIGYLGTNDPYDGFIGNDENLKKQRGLDPKSLAKKMLTNAKRELVKAKVEIEKIHTVEGGYVNGEKRVEIWFVPEGGKFPKPKPDYYPNTKK